MTKVEPIMQSLMRSQTLSEGSDAPANTSTPYSMSVGDRFDGVLSQVGGQDWIRISLEETQTYVFTVFGRGGLSAGMSDTILTVRDSEGTAIWQNDDADYNGGIAFSALTFTAETTGTYYIEVSGYQDSGRYTVQAATNVYTVDQVVSQLTEFNWGRPMPLRFDVGVGGTLTYNLTGLTAAGQQLAEWAFEAWEIATGITFSSSASASADIILDDNQSGAFAGPSAFDADGIISQSNVNISVNWLSNYGTTIDSYSFLTYMHEIGHALGLGHSGNYDGSASYAADALYRNDSYQMTIMSYFDMVDNTYIDGSDDRPVTPMIADVAAMSFLYGTPATAHAGNTVWGSNSNVGGYLQDLFDILVDGATDPDFYDGGPIMFTIQDSSGTDVVDLTPLDADQRIDLRAGAVSDVAGRVGNVVIAQGTVIENVRLGAGQDVITGNDAANEIAGGRGNDTAYGGAGSDTYVVAATRAATTVDAATGGYRLISVDGNDLIFDFEFVRFSDQTVAVADLLAAPPEPTPGDDTLTGTSGNDRVSLMGGNDIYTALGGSDSIYGEAGDDTIYGGTGADWLAPGDGNDEIWGGTTGGDFIVYGSAGHGLVIDLSTNTATGGGWTDRIYEIENVSGSTFDDTITGDSAANVLRGQNGRDTFFATAGNDVYEGGGSTDTISYQSATTGIALSLTTQTGTAGLAAGHTIREIEMVIGGSFNDTIEGSALRDFLSGRDGDDRLIATLGADVFYGGFGTDEVDYSSATAGVRVFLNTGIGDGGMALGQRYVSIEDVTGSGHGDRISGSRSANRIDGAEGNDTIYSYEGADEILLGAGDDYVQAGDGDDTVYGGAGADTIWAGAGVDEIVFDGNFADFSIARLTARSTRVTALTGDRAIDLVYDAEVLVFNDRDYLVV